VHRPSQDVPLSVSDYYTKMCHYADDLAASRNPLRGDELVAYLLANLDEDFNPFFTAIVARVDLISPSELYAQLLSSEHHTNLQGTTTSGTSSSTLSAVRGRGSGGSSRDNSRGRGHGHGPSRGGFNNQSGKSSKSGSGSSSCPQCQLCLKIGHSAKTCWYRYEDNSSFEPRHAALATTSDVDNNWYTDSEAMDHITGDLYKLTMHDTYLGNDQIHTKNGSGMNTTRIGNTIIPLHLVTSC
jgi:hypothetical protein